MRARRAERKNKVAGKVVVFGSFVADLTARGARFPAPGETVIGHSFLSGPGGKGSNQAVAAHRAGADVTLVTKLGRDTFGAMAREFYTKEQMNTDALLEDAEKPTGGALIMVNEKTGQNMIMVVTGACNHITLDDVAARAELIARADYLLVQMEINLDALKSVIRIAHENGTKVILNPAPALAIEDEVLSLVDTVTPNETEAFVLTGVKVETKEDARKAARVFFDKGVSNVIITLGDKGVYVANAKREALYPRIVVQAVDTTGAGDAFNGGLVKALAQGMDLFEAAQYGNCTGALAVTRCGTAPAMPYQQEIDALFTKTYGK